MDTQGASIENRFGPTQRPNANVLYRHLKHVQHACANEAVANPGVDIAKLGSNTLVLWLARNFETLCGALKVSKDFPEFAKRLGCVSLEDQRTKSKPMPYETNALAA